MARARSARDDRFMPRYPSFYIWGALAGFALWLTHAPPPFPLLASIVMIAGIAGCATSLAYLYYFDRWQWRVKAAAMRRFGRVLSRGASMRSRAAVVPRRRFDAPAIAEWDAAAAGETPPGTAPGAWIVTP